MSYRGGGEYGHGGYHQDMPVAQLGDMSIDPDEFPKVAQHLQSLHISHPGSSSGSTGYPEDGTRYLHIDPTGAHYYTNEAPSSIATYSGYGYIQAPEHSPGAPHAFAGALRTPVNPSFSHGRDRYEPSQDSYDEPRGRRQTYYRPSGEGYITPGANIPRTSTKTPGPGGEVAALRRGTIAAIHQPRPPNSRHSSSESGDAEPTYHPSARYDPEYNGNTRPKGKSRPNSFSYPRPTDSEPNFSARYSFVPESPFDPRSSTGSLGNAGSRFNPSAIVHQQSDRYYKQYDPPSGSATVTPGGWGKGQSYKYAPHPSRPIDYSPYPGPAERERETFESRGRRARSKSRFPARTPGPEERNSASEDDRYRPSVTKSRPSSPSSSQQRAKSRRRRDSPSPGPYRAKSRMRSKSRPRPEIIQPTRPLPGDSPVRPSTPGSARPKTPMPGSSTDIDTEAMIRMEAERQERESARQEKARQEKTRQEQARQEQERQEKERAIQEIWQSVQRVSSDQEGSQSRSSDKENYNIQEQQHHHHHQSHRSRARSRPRDQHSRSTSNERSERENAKEERRRERERQRDSDQERERENERNKDREREKERERREKAREETLQKLKSESASKVTDPALANPMVENMNPPGRNRERAGVQPGQEFIRPDLLCAMKKLKLCYVEHDPNDDHAHNYLLRLDCGHGYHEDCLRSAVSSRERIPHAQVDLEAEKLWCERCRNTFGKKAGM